MAARRGGLGPRNRGYRPQIGHNRLQIGSGQPTQALIDRLQHRAGSLGTVARIAIPQIGDKLPSRPTADAAIDVRCDVGREPGTE